MFVLQSRRRLILWLALALTAPRVVEIAKAGDLQFNRDIRPILSENCFQCHGPDAKHREADLRLDQRDSALAKRDHGAAITSGNIAASELVKRIISTDEDLQMPPAKSGRKLTAEQIALLRQ